MFCGFPLEQCHSHLTDEQKLIKELIVYFGHEIAYELNDGFTKCSRNLSCRGRDSGAILMLQEWGVPF